MIAGLIGEIEAKSADTIFVNVNGVIYRVGTSTPTLATAGDRGDGIKLYTRLIVREDQLSLFGFLTLEELTSFDAVTGVSGIGPRIACAMLSAFAPERLHAAVEAGDIDLLSTVPGIGKKTAARLVVELRGKLPGSMAGPSAATPIDQEVIAALRSLGYSPSEAASAAARLRDEDGDTVELRVIAALHSLSDV